MSVWTSWEAVVPGDSSRERTVSLGGAEVVEEEGARREMKEREG